MLIGHLLYQDLIKEMVLTKKSFTTTALSNAG